MTQHSNSPEPFDDAEDGSDVEPGQNLGTESKALDVTASESRLSKSSLWRGIVRTAADAAENVTDVAQNVVHTTTEATVRTAQKVSDTTQSMVSGVGDAVTSSTDAMTITGKAIISATTETSQSLVTSVGTGVVTVGTTLGSGATQAGQAIVENISHATSGAGQALSWMGRHAHLQHLTRAIKVDWLVNIIDAVNVDNVEAHVEALKQKYPDATPYQLAGRIMAMKALYVGGSGLASSLVPGVASAMVAVDLATNTAIQAEMGYQIAAAYGLDVHAPERKGEILAIFGLALGGSQALKTGFQYMARNVPVAGAVVGASTNAVALYAVGHAACQFYERKLSEAEVEDDPGLIEEGQKSLPGTAMAGDGEPEEVEQAKVAQEQYFQEAIAQQIIMDQVLAHVLLAGYPDKTWPELIPMLEDLHFSPASIQLITHYAQAPINIDELLAQVNAEFSVPLVAQCQKLVEADHHCTEEEKQIMLHIRQKLAPDVPMTDAQEW